MMAGEFAPGDRWAGTMGCWSHLAAIAAPALVDLSRAGEDHFRRAGGALRRDRGAD